MNNYKELVAALREEAEAVKAVEWDIPICTSNHIAEAANEIENLRDELCQRCGKYRVAHMGGCNGCRYE